MPSTSSTCASTRPARSSAAASLRRPTATSTPRPGPVFGDFTYDVTDQFSASAGVRYTSDKRHAVVLPAEPALRRLARTRRRRRSAVGLGRRPTSELRRQAQGHGFHAALLGQLQAERRSQHLRQLFAGFKGGGFDPRGQTSRRPTSTATARATESRSTNSWLSIQKPSTATNSAGRDRPVRPPVNWALAASTPTTRTSRCPDRRVRDIVGGVPTLLRRDDQCRQGAASRASNSKQPRSCRKLRKLGRSPELRRLARLPGRASSRVPDRVDHPGSRARSTSPEFAQGPEYAEMDAQRLARLRHA